MGKYVLVALLLFVLLIIFLFVYAKYKYTQASEYAKFVAGCLKKIKCEVNEVEREWLEGLIEYLEHVSSPEYRTTKNIIKHRVLVDIGMAEDEGLFSEDIKKRIYDAIE